MKYDTEIIAQLRKLKLSGVLDTLDVRVLESQKNQLDYITFLSLLLLDELEARQARKIQRLISDARFGHEQTIENFDFTLAPYLNKTHILELAACRFIKSGEGIIFVGPPGTGKTHLAKAIGHQACRKLCSVRFCKYHKLFAELTHADLDGSLDRLLKKLLSCDLLIIDDFAFKKIDQKNSEFLYNIVDSRYGVKSIILTSNRAMTDWMNVFPDPVIAGAILDRLAHQAHQISLKGESMRKKMVKKTTAKEL